ncbi:putative sugar phosphate/phosphate translocator [Camellia lanceoleosa]|uniref:Sugar phosphate/phosphate translocator n=1 Tax=Camellia lanceoleosa TaxID=1840588 RepID=A0ACC0F7A4_9ERIC|nr:putative sugar phosphate/phosphate translocator [Camellia lanceoleosa]
MLLIMSVISFGVLVVSYEEIDINWIGLVYQMGEKPKMGAQGTWSFQPVILTLNSLCTFALNLSVFLVISHTSGLTIRVAGVVKD